MKRRNPNDECRRNAQIASLSTSRKGMKNTSPTIRVRNLQRQIRVNVRDLERFSQRALQAREGLPRRRRGADIFPDEISVLLISDRRMACLHRQFLNKSGPTDVITFQHGEIFI